MNGPLWVMELGQGGADDCVVQVSFGEPRDEYHMTLMVVLLLLLLRGICQKLRLITLRLVSLIFVLHYQ